eukprot:TRINITY_DN4249_c0_g1_i7.p1 TRINITY_DN4249_c0_g1~~TRINITY_DN4249_c0_g1_i7.p1  ORF type:complete len:343 (+),score=69.37 TRINITY_DN4249_c0_g1_i7:112-1140(+)
MQTDYSFDEKRQEGQALAALIGNYEILRVLGAGTYAKVVLAKEITTGEIVAIKMLRRMQIQTAHQAQALKTERDILVTSDHPFIVKLRAAYQGEKNLYFVLEYCPGGELYFLLRRRLMLSEDQARFYAGQILLALEYLHSRDIAYRDLKPENILLDEEGYVRLADFGLSAVNREGEEMTSVCGTPEYVAPEMLVYRKYDKKIDVWALGVLLFEMLTGVSPFAGQTRPELFRNIAYTPLRLPKHFSAEVKSLIGGLLQKNPAQRMSLEEAKNHPWFNSLDWDLLLNKRLKPPFTPKLKSKVDVSYFDKEFTDSCLSIATDASPISPENDDFTFEFPPKEILTT